MAKVQARASRVFTGWLRWTKLIQPDTISFDGRQIKISRWRWLGFLKDEEVVSLDDIARVSIVRGVFTATLVVETAGGAMADLKVAGLPKSAAEKMLDVLQKAKSRSKREG